MIEFLKWAAIALGALLVLVLLTTLFADELVRMVARKRVPSPIDLPRGGQIRESTRLVRLLGFGVGRAAAVTVGFTILVHARVIIQSADEYYERLRIAWDESPSRGWATESRLMLPETWQTLIRHEAVHVEQRIRYGRLYLPRYLVLFAVAFLRHGKAAHAHHALENEARTKAGQV